MRRLILVVLLCVGAVNAAVQRGAVKANGTPIPGATVTAIQGDLKQTTSTDEAGNYVFENLAPGKCTIEVEMFGFAKTSKEIEVTAEAAPVSWDLKLKGAQAMLAEIAATRQPPAETVKPAETTKPAEAATGADTKPAPAPPAPAAASTVPGGNRPAAPVNTPAAAQANASPNAKKAPDTRSARNAGNTTAGRNTQNPQNQRPGFQRAGVSQTAQDPQVTAENAAQREGLQTENLEQNANESLLVTGSVSRGLQVQGGPDDFGRPDFGMMMGGMGRDGMGPGGPEGMGGPGGTPGLPGAQGREGGQGGPGGGGPGGRGGVMAGGPGMGGGGGGMMGGGGGGRGGFGGPGGGGRGGGPGGRGGDRGGARGGDRAAWQNRAQVSLLGNRRGRGQDGYHGMAALNNFADSVFDARNYSLNGQSVDKPSFRSANYNFMLGGPLYIPKLIERTSKTNINLTFGGNFGQNGQTGVATVPSELERTGNFSQSVVRNAAVSIYDPLTGLQFPNNLIPASRLNPAAIGLLQFIPHANQPTTIQNYQRSWSNPTGGNKNLGARVMQTLSRKDRLSFNYSFQNRNTHSQSLLGFVDPSSGRGQNFGVSWTHNITGKLISNASLNFSRNHNQTVPFFAYGDNIAQQLGITGVSTDPLNYGPPTLSFTNFVSLNDASPTLSTNQTTGANESFTWSHGKQTIGFGGGYRRMQTDSHTDSNGRGTFTFTGFATSQLDAKGQAINGTGLDLADFLLGLPQQTSIRFGASNIYMRSKVYNLYVQDDWRLFTRLSLNVGLRWEVQPPITEKFGRMANLDIAPGYTAAAVVTPGSVGPYSGAIPDGLIHTDYHVLAPRFGFAWRPFKKASTRVRGGYGIYFNSSVYNSISNRLAQQPPFAKSGTFTSSLAAPLTLQNGFAGSPTTSITNTFAVDPFYKPGYAQTWSLSIQHDVRRSLTIDLNYMGTKGTRLDVQTSPNVPLPGVTVMNQIANASTFIYQSSQANSIYHAFQVSVNRRLGRGLSLNSRYSFSKLIDNSQTLGNVVAQNYLNLAAERAVDNAPHSFSAGYMLTSPVGDSSALFSAHGWSGRLLRDWTLNGNINLSSGGYFTANVLGSRAISGTGVSGSLRADATGLPVKSDTGYFNLAAFSVPAAGRLGNAGRNTVPGPGSFNMGTSFGRTFRLKETRRSIDFHVQASNPLNWVNISRFGTTLNSTTYGIATAAGRMRTVTMNLRFRF